MNVAKKKEKADLGPITKEEAMTNISKYLQNQQGAQFFQDHMDELSPHELSVLFNAIIKNDSMVHMIYIKK